MSPSVADSSGSYLRSSPRRLPAVQCEGGMDSVGHTQESADDRLSVVFGWLGSADELERSGQLFSRQLGPRLQFGKTFSVVDC